MSCALLRANTYYHAHINTSSISMHHHGANILYNREYSDSVHVHQWNLGAAIHDHHLSIARADYRLSVCAILQYS